MPKSREKKAAPIEIQTPKRGFTPCEGVEILSRGTENLREQYVASLRGSMESFYKMAGLSELMFLWDAVFAWESNAGVITRRCLIADVLLNKMGGDVEHSESELIRYYDNGQTAQAEAKGVK
jgi:hypothetical protein